MSATQIVAFDRDGNAYVYAEARNAWRGGHAIWSEMERRHLPRYVPNWLPPKVSGDQYLRMSDEEIKRHFSFIATRCSSLGDEKGMREVWGLYQKPDVPEYEQITLLTTLDGVVVMKKDFDQVTRAFIAFGGDTNLPEQIEILCHMMGNDNVIACAWNQSSVAGDAWTATDYCDNCEECGGHNRPYNLFKDTGHWIMFEEEEIDG